MSKKIDLYTHQHDEYTWWEYDARGIELCKVCHTCLNTQLAQYRPDVLSDPNYWSDENIEQSDYV